MSFKKLKKGIALSLSVLAITSSLSMNAFADTDNNTETITTDVNVASISTTPAQDAVINSYMSTIKSKSDQRNIQSYIASLNYKKNFDYDKELQKISKKYNDGDILNEKDTKIIFESFILEAENEMANASARAGSSSKSIPSKTLTKYNTKVTLSGTMYQNIALGGGTNTYRGNVKVVRNSGATTSVEMTTYHSGYGGAGWNGSFPEIGLIHNGSVNHTQSTTGANYGMDKSNRYNGLLICYTTMWTKATVTVKSGQAFDIASATWKSTQ